MGKTGRKNKVYSAEFKIGIIMDMREHRLGFRETARKYELIVNVRGFSGKYGTTVGTHIPRRRSRRSNERKTRQSLFR